MRRLIRNIDGERPPLIMDRRFQRLRVMDEYARYRVRRALRIAYRRPRYLTPRCSPEQEMRGLLAIEAFVGRHSPDPRLVRYYNERSRLLRLANPSVADEIKQRLIAEGPRCSPEDEAHVLSLCETGEYLLADPEAQAALSRIKREAELTVARLAESASGGAR